MQTTTVSVNVADGRSNSITLNNVPMPCPMCGVRMVPIFLQMSYTGRRGYTLFCRCTNTECEHTFISKYKKISTVDQGLQYVFNGIQHDMAWKKEEFNDVISDISSAFVEIYNQAYAAQQMGLVDICGVGYRKALEFLIKDYVMSSMTDETEKEKVKKKQLGICIKEDITAPNIKEIAKRATWLGNDETHYVRKWEDKDIHNLIETIQLTIHWIEAEEATKRILADMAEPK